MTEVVVYLAGDLDADRVRQQLIDSRAPLAQAGVALPASDDPADWRRLAKQLLRGASADRVLALLADAEQARARTIVVSCEGALDRLPDAEGLRHLRRFTRHHDITATIVVTLADQLATVNSFYCRAVTHLDWAGSFDEYVDDARHLAGLDFRDLLWPLLEGPIQAVVLARQQVADDPAAGLLRGLGRSDSDVTAVGLARPAPPGADPGPRSVAAIRLLHKRMRRLALFGTCPRPTLTEAVGRLARHAEEQQWDTCPFWGWTTARADEVMGRFAAGNAELAQRLWAGDWPESAADRAATVVDLATESPALVVDLIDTVDSLVHDLRRGSERNEPAASAS